MLQNELPTLKSIEYELTMLEGCAQSFPKVFAKEEDAVIEHDIAALEQVAYEKSQLLKQLQKSIETVSRLCGSLCTDSSVPQSFSDMRAMLAEHLRSNLNSSQGHSTAMIKKIINTLDKLTMAYSHIKPQIEKNRFIIARLLHNHQESYRFWSELKKQNSSNYDDKGARRSQSTISQVFAKA